jgi:hypothetical protein
MTVLTLQFTLASDALLGQGDGVAGLVDEEVRHDRYGCPYLAGKTLKGMLVNECADILDALPAAKQEKWRNAARLLFGEPGMMSAGIARMQVGDATLPPDLREAVVEAVQQGQLRRTDVLSALTTLRQQTAMDPDEGIPKEKTLRTMRMVLRNTQFAAALWLEDDADTTDTRRLLATTVTALRRIGTGRNRGHGRLCGLKLVDAQGENLLARETEAFCQEVLT